MIRAFSILGYDAAQSIENQPTFRRNFSSTFFVVVS
jgi:hypothetical protein